VRTSTISLTIQSPGRRMRSSVPSVKNTCEEQHAVARSCRCAGCGAALSTRLVLENAESSLFKYAASRSPSGGGLAPDSGIT
jgi:hypothetical protein